MVYGPFAPFPALRILPIVFHLPLTHRLPKLVRFLLPDRSLRSPLVPPLPLEPPEVTTSFSYRSALPPSISEFAHHELRQTSSDVRLLLPSLCADAFYAPPLPPRVSACSPAFVASDQPVQLLHEPALRKCHRIRGLPFSRREYLRYTKKCMSQ